MTKQEVLDACTIKGNNVYLPDVQLDRKLYTEVNKALVGIGGKWNRKEKAHVFPNDPSELMGRVKDGENINLKKDYQFFETPRELADRLVEYADLERHHHILEPSAGRGAIVNAILREVETPIISMCEAMPENIDYLRKSYIAPGMSIFTETDFLTVEPSKYGGYDRVIANPPFAKNQDIDHVYKMYDMLNSGGRLVSITSMHWQISSNKKETKFRKFLKEVGAKTEKIERGAFKGSGTMVGGLIVVIDK